MLTTEIKFGEVRDLAATASYKDDAVAFGHVFETKHGGVSVLAFKPGDKLDTHLAPAMVMVTALEGEIKFTMLDRTHVLKAGQYLLMGADVPHSVESLTASKVLLVKVKD